MFCLVFLGDRGNQTNPLWPRVVERLSFVGVDVNCWKRSQALFGDGDVVSIVLVETECAEGAFSTSSSSGLLFFIIIIIIIIMILESFFFFTSSFEHFQETEN